MTGEYEYSVYDKNQHIYHFAKDKPLAVNAREEHGTETA
jgi:hypothetical protein